MSQDNYISRFSITQQVSFLAGLFLAGFAIFIALSTFVITKASVNGPIYAKIVQGKDLVADILPPPEYVIEAYLGTFQAMEETDGAKIDEHIKNFARLRKEFEERQDYWKKELSSGETKTLLNGEAAQSARDFFASAEKDFFPALKKADITTARTIQRDVLTPQYARHRGAIDKIVTLSNASNDKIEKETASLLSFYNWLMFAVVLAGLALIAFVSVLIIRSIHRTITTCASITDAISHGNLTVVVPEGGSGSIKILLESLATMSQFLREIIASTMDVSNNIASASNQLHATSSQIAAGAEEVANQTSTLATASEEMSATSGEIARNCSMAADASHHTTDSADAGARVVSETIGGMSVIADRVRQTSVTIEALGTRSEQIGAIIGTIEDIADQTNLLALNAAIEAARAGEQGRGFAVVADEVRALAERTTKATKEIGEMIKAIQNETRSAVNAMEEGVNEVEKGAKSSQQSGNALEEIRVRINEVTMQINQIATAAEEQTATTSEVTNNIQHVIDIVHQTARGAEETAGAASLLAQQAHQLQVIIGKFRVA